MRWLQYICSTITAFIIDIDNKTIDIKLPTRWEELTLKQLRYLFGMIAQGYSIDEVKALCLFRCNKITIQHRYGDDGYMCKSGNPGDIGQAKKR